MAGRTEILNALKGGIDRRKTKGGVAPDRLHDLLDGYVNSAGDAEQRPGTSLVVNLPAGTKGMFQHAGKLNVVAGSVVTPPADINVHVIRHPTVPTATLVDIHFAEPYLGFPYVAAEWSDGSTWHYWLQANETWQPNRIYRDGQTVQPTTPNGFAYRAYRLTPEAKPWAASVPRAVNDRVRPTAGGDYEHVVVSVVGSAPRSGTTEPPWAQAEGGITLEDADNTPPPASTTPPPPTDSLPPDVTDRYGGGGGMNDNFTQVLK